MRTFLLALILIPLLFLPAQAGELEGVTLPDTLEQDGGQLMLNGMAERSVLWISVYIAGLYLPEITNDAQAALDMDGAKRMVMVFQRDVAGTDICDAWKEGFEKNVSGGGLHFLDKLEQLCEDTPTDTLDGQTASYAYSASTDETVYSVDDTILGTYAGREFFTALLSCWIGPEPGPGEDFKEGVLGLE